MSAILEIYYPSTREIFNTWTKIPFSFQEDKFIKWSLDHLRGRFKVTSSYWYFEYPEDASLFALKFSEIKA